MGTPWNGPVIINNGCCDRLPGSSPPDVAAYVVSLQGLYGIITFANTGAITWSTYGNAITASLTAEAGLGSVTSVGVSSTSLTIGGTNPVLTTGTITVELTGAVASIQGLTTAADKMIYTTASNTYAVTDLTSFARTLLDDANAAASRTTLGLVIGTNVQAFSQDLSDFVTNSSWTGSDLALAGALTVNGNLEAADITGSNLDLNGGSITDCTNITVTNLSATNIAGDGGNITNLSATNIANGTLAVARGGTGLASYAVGDLLMATGTTTIGKLADVAAGSILRSGGVGVIPAWTTYAVPSFITTGDILFAASSSAVSKLADVATGNVLLSGGVATAPAYGKVTTSHTTGIAASGVNADITGFAGNAISFADPVTLSNDTQFQLGLLDGSGSAGTSGQVLSSTGSATEWSNQLSLDTLYLATSFSLEGTLTGAGTTGPVTINKPCGTARFAAAATSLTVTNSLCTTSHRVQATVCTNDTTLKSCQAVTTTGAFTLFANAGATAETEVFWELILVG